VLSCPQISNYAGHVNLGLRDFAEFLPAVPLQEFRNVVVVLDQSPIYSRRYSRRHGDHPGAAASVAVLKNVQW
jgi:hypothetical protein